MASRPTQRHPSGRFLFVIDSKARLRVYSISESGQLELRESIDQAGGSMAVTVRDAQTAGH